MFSYSTEVDLNAQSSEEEPNDFKFVKWLTKEKVNIKDYVINLFNRVQAL